MGATNADPRADESPVARAVTEAIDSVAAPDVRVQILNRALHMSREHRIPEHGMALRQFVERHLRLATAFYVGEQAADAVITHLDPILTLAQSLGPAASMPVSKDDPTTRKFSQPSPRSGMSPSGTRSQQVMSETDKYPTVRPSGATLPMVLVATRDNERCASIEAYLDGAAAVQQVGDVVAFLDNIQATASLSPLVVIDCVEASVQPTTLATLAHELPQESAVLLWGASEDDHKDLTSLAKRDRGWLRCGAEANASDVAALIHMLIGE